MNRKSSINHFNINCSAYVNIICKKCPKMPLFTLKSDEFISQIRRKRQDSPAKPCLIEIERKLLLPSCCC